MEERGPCPSTRAIAAARSHDFLLTRLACVNVVGGGAQMDNTIEVRGGTLEKLVMRLLHEATPRLSPEFITDFILTHRSFTTTDEVLAHLMKRCVTCAHPPPHLAFDRRERG